MKFTAIHILAKAVPKNFSNNGMLMNLNEFLSQNANIMTL